MKKLEALAPWVFVIIWSSGFVVAKYAFASSDSLFFLAIRLALAAGILFALTVAFKAPIRLSSEDFRASLVIGICLHGFYLAGVWYAIEKGAPAGFSSVITSLQPVFVSLIAVWLLREPLKVAQIAGLIFGLGGVALVVAPKLLASDGFTAETLLLLTLALSGSTAATLLQKKIGHSIPLMIGTTYQFAIAAAALFLISIATGKTRFELTQTAFWSMSWAVLVTSIAAVLLLLWLLNRGSAAKVSSLLYLVPPMSVLQAWILFGEKVNAQSIIGMSMTALGVFLVVRS
jgi:drug/metabolite transporter (DMT)-like permease